MKGLSILAFGAHPDDVELLCSGTLAKYKKLENKISIAVATNGNVGHPTLKSEEIEHKQRELLALFGLWMDTVSQCARLGDSENPTVNKQ